MLKMLNQLLYIKEHREQKAERLMLSARQAYLESVEEVQKGQSILDNYSLFIEREEKRLYSSLIGKSIKVSAIEEVRDSMAVMKGKKVQYQERIVELEQQKKKRYEEWNTKKKEHIYAVKKKNKFFELIEFRRKEEESEQERVEDNELDELGSLGPQKYREENESDYA